MEGNNMKGSKKSKGKNRKASFPRLKKDIKDFLLSEEGKVSKKKAIKMGMAVGAIALMMKPDNAAAHNSGALTTGVRGGAWFACFSYFSCLSCFSFFPWFSRLWRMVLKVTMVYVKHARDFF